jgi:hypothetical protein
MWEGKSQKRARTLNPRKVVQRVHVWFTCTFPSYSTYAKGTKGPQRLWLNSAKQNDVSLS